MRRLFALVLTLFTAAGLSAAEIDSAVKAMNGVEAGFTHSFTPKGFKKAQIEKGSIVFGQLPMMRWSYQTPEQKTFVFDGTRSWFYVPADKQVTVADIDDRRRAELPFLVLGDARERDKQFFVREQRGRGSIVTTLQPRNTASVIRAVSVKSNPSNHVIQSIEYSDRDGNRTLFSFSGYHPARVTADTFRFAAPAGVQTVRAN